MLCCVVLCCVVLCCVVLCCAVLCCGVVWFAVRHCAVLGWVSWFGVWSGVVWSAWGGVVYLRHLPLPCEAAAAPSAVSQGSSQVVMLGDQCQLPPTVIADDVAREGLDISMFDRLIGNGMPTHILRVQYRMHPSISAFPSLRFYKGLLQNGVDDADRPLPPVALPHAFDASSHVCVLNVEGAEQTQGSSKYNTEEARAVAVLCQRLVEAGIARADIGVITPYAAHVTCIARELQLVIGDSRQIDISSVDGYARLELPRPPVSNGRLVQGTLP